MTSTKSDPDYDVELGEEMYGWARDLFPICRSLTGPGVRETLGYLARIVPHLELVETPSGTQAFDWTVPPEWTIRDAYVADEDGVRVIDFRENNLHVLGYSEPVDAWLDLDELQAHLYSLPEQPNAIPYVTSYYARRWGFCLSHHQRERLKKGRYHAVIDADLQPGFMTYAEAIIPGSEDGEVLLSTYVCHPSMANNELSGPVVTAALARWLASKPRRFTYRILFAPETIGSILYLSQHAEHMKRHTLAGFVVTCVGDERTYSFMPSRKGGTLADRVAEHVLKRHANAYQHFDFLSRGSDERQYCSPKIDLPVVAIMRSSYTAYPEYHTSLDDLNLITPAGLNGSFEALRKCIEILEMNCTYTNVFSCEPQLGKRGLYPTLSERNSSNMVKTMMDVIAYSDGTLDIISLADRIDADALECGRIAKQLEEAGVLAKIV